MSKACEIKGCKTEVPPALGEHNLCVLHFTLSVENSCAGMRRETALGNAPQERQREILQFISEHGERLARVATSGLPAQPDDLKARILSTFLTLMNLRENLDRAKHAQLLRPLRPVALEISPDLENSAGHPLTRCFSGGNPFSCIAHARKLNSSRKFVRPSHRDFLPLNNLTASFPAGARLCWSR